MNRKPQSGHFDTRDDDDPRRIDDRVKKRAETIARWEVGSASEWNQFVEQAEGEVSWEGFDKWMGDRGWKSAATYSYCAADGRQLYQSIRYNYELFPSKKRFIQRHRIGDGKWIHDGGPVRVPYNLPELAKRPDEPITLVEGEKGVDFLKGKLLASCVQGQNWSHDVVRPFAGRIVNVVMDNDDAGLQNTKDAIEWLGKVGAIVRVIELPGAGPGDGLDDWLTAHELSEYQDIVARTKPELSSNGVIVASAHKFKAETEYPPWDWLYGRHLLRGTVSATAAMGGTGKSSMAIAEALAMVTGKPLLGVASTFHKEESPLRVLLVNLEDNREAVDKRILAAMKHYHLTPEQIGNRLFTIAKGELNFKIAGQARYELVQRNMIAIRGMINFCLDNAIDVLSVDPFIATHSVTENDNTSIRNVIECFDVIAEAARCAVSLWHHSRKANGQDVTIDAVRGAGAFVDACRSVRVLETMTKTEAKELGLERAGSYFRSFSGKLNFAPPSEQSDWFHIANIQLNNCPMFGDASFLGDEVGVVERWDHPLKGGTAVDLSMDEISEVRREIASSDGWREDQRSNMWAGKAIATALNIDLEQTKKIKSILNKMIFTGVLRRETRNDRSTDYKDKLVIKCGGAA